MQNKSWAGQIMYVTGKQEPNVFQTRGFQLGICRYLGSTESTSFYSSGLLGKEKPKVNAKKPRQA